MTRKEKLVSDILSRCTAINRACDELKDSIDVFLDRGHQSGGSDPIIQDDLDVFGITLAQLVLIKTFSDNIELFLNNDLPAQSDYGKFLNQIRQDK